MCTFPLSGELQRETTLLEFEECGNKTCTNILTKTERITITLERTSNTHGGIRLNPFEGVVTIIDGLGGI